MTLTTLDWLILAAFLVFPFVVAARAAPRAGESLGQYFLAGRELPWWLAGTSMVATTFAADTPLAVAGIVATDGIAGNWIWWSAALGSMLSVLFFARLWRRAGILTDVAFVELRYGGRPAALLRGCRALYLGLPVNCLIIGWVNLAMAKILSVTLGWDRLTAVFVGLALTGGYVSLSGLRGVVLTDLVQFGLAMGGAIVVAVYALGVPEVGGVAGLNDQLPESTFRFRVYPGFPTIFRGLSEFFVGDLMGKALWKLVENAQRFPRRGGRVLCVHGPSASTGLVRVRQNGPRGGGLRTGPPASSDCGRPVNDKCSHQHRRSVQAERSSYPGKTVISGTYAIWETRI